MSNTYPIADTFSRIRNAIAVQENEVEIPFSKAKVGICKIMKEDGFIRFFEVLNVDLKKQVIKIGLKYDTSGQSMISHIETVSKPSNRIYIKKERIPKVLGGFGSCFISTSKGIMSGRMARLNNMGGELLGIVY